MQRTRLVRSSPWITQVTPEHKRKVKKSVKVLKKRMKHYTGNLSSSAPSDESSSPPTSSTNHAVSDQLPEENFSWTHGRSCPTSGVGEGTSLGNGTKLEPLLDEDGMWKKFGMRGFITPSVRGFDGLFKQHWRDFRVTEMVKKNTLVPRVYNFSIPEWSMRMMGFNGEEEESTLAKYGNVSASFTVPSHKYRGNAEDFFSVDTQKQLQLAMEGIKIQPSSVVEGKGTASDVAVEPEDLEPTTMMDGGRITGSKNEGEELEVVEQQRAEEEEGDEEDRKSVFIDRLHGLHSTMDGGKRPSGRNSLFATESEQRKLSTQTPEDGIFYVQCFMHKKHFAHSEALAKIAAALRISPRHISCAGIKDYNGDTAQRIRVMNCSPASLLEVSKQFKKNGVPVVLYGFSYETTPLHEGDLFGNHFRIVLRDVTASKENIVKAMHSLQANGFPNFYGCQRFSYFRGKDDPSFALYHKRWLSLAWRMLDFTTESHTLREVLQRRHAFPTTLMHIFRRKIVESMRLNGTEPQFLDLPQLTSCPELATTDAELLSERNPYEWNIVNSIEEAYKSISLQTRRLAAVRLSSLLWNEALSNRIARYGNEVLVGDFVVPYEFRQLAVEREEKENWFAKFGSVVTEENKHLYTILDVVHPSFCFDDFPLPRNDVANIYHQLCDRHALRWTNPLRSQDIPDFYELPRPIIRVPMNLRWHLNEEKKILIVEFALERGCYANVALTELMKLSECLGTASVTLLPRHESEWEAGRHDPGYVPSMEDCYETRKVDYTLGDLDPVDTSLMEDVSYFELDKQGFQLFKPSSEDPYHLAAKWASRNLLSRSKRRLADEEAMKKRLFEKPLRDKIGDFSIGGYAGHTVPLRANQLSSRIAAKVRRRQQAYAKAPKFKPRIQIGADVKSQRRDTPDTVHRSFWNFRW